MPLILNSPIVSSMVLEKLSEHGAIHHGFMVYDVDIKAMKSFGQTLDMEVVEI